MDKQGSRFDGPITAKQLAMIIWVPVALGLLIWLVVTSAQTSRQKAEIREREAKAAQVQTQKARRDLDRRLEQLRVLEQSPDR